MLGLEGVEYKPLGDDGPIMTEQPASPWLPINADFNVGNVEIDPPAAKPSFEGMTDIIEEVQRLAIDEALKRRLFNIESKLRESFRELIALLDEMRGYGD
jgi:hypothetical protein